MSLARFVLVAVAVVSLTTPARADIYRWDNGAAIPGTEGITPGPGVDLASWNEDSHNLRFADLADTNLASSMLLQSWLDNATLTRADLSYAMLTQANLRGTDFTGALIKYASFAYTTESGFAADQLYSTASYGAKDLRGINLGHNDMSGWDFEDQDLRGANFSSAVKANLSGANLSYANLTGARLHSVDITSTDLNGAIISDAWFWGGTRLTIDQLYSTASYKRRNLRGLFAEGGKWNGVDLSKQNLTSANLNSGSLIAANLSQANLTNADLSNAALTGANLSGALVTGASFGGGESNGITKEQLYSTQSYQQSNLSGIQLWGKDLDGWDLSNQNLSNADLTQAEFNGARLDGARVNWTQFGRSSIAKEQLYSTMSYHEKNLQGIGLIDLDLRGWDFSGQDIRHANFAGTASLGFSKEQFYLTGSYQQKDLEGIVLDHNDHTGWDFSRANLADASFSYGNLSAVSLHEANLSRARFADTDLSGADLTASNLSGAYFYGGTLANADLTGATIAGAIFSNVTSAGFTRQQLHSTASFREKQLAGTFFRGNDLRGWDFSNQDLTGSAFWGCDLTGTQFANADLTGANLRHSRGFTPDATTITRNLLWPNGEIRGLELTAGETFVLPGPDHTEDSVRVTTRFVVPHGSLIEIPFPGQGIEGPGRVAIDDGAEVILGGTLRIGATSYGIGAAFRLFDWPTPLATANRFSSVQVPVGTTWDVTDLYSYGFVSLVEMREDDADVTVSPGASYVAGGLNARSVTLAGAGSRLTVATVGGSNSPITVNALNIANGAILDLTDNDAIVDYTGASPIATIREKILSGRGGPGLGAEWNGTGITSSTAAAANATEVDSRSLGYAENAALPLGPYTTFHGAPVDNTSILMAYTRTGDANLDGLVNDDDVTIIGATYAPGVPNPNWALGDFDYNGFVDDDDVTLLGAFYNASAAPLIAPAPQTTTAVSAVPEPSTIVLLMIMVAAVGILGAKRQSTQIAPDLCRPMDV